MPENNENKVFILSTGEKESVDTADSVISSLTTKGIEYFYYKNGDYKDKNLETITDIYDQLAGANYIIIILSEEYINGKLKCNERLNKDNSGYDLLEGGVYCFKEINSIMQSVRGNTIYKLPGRVYPIVYDETFLKKLYDKKIKFTYDKAIEGYVTRADVQEKEVNLLTGAKNSIREFIDSLSNDDQGALRGYIKKPNDIEELVDEINSNINNSDALLPGFLKKIDNSFFQALPTKQGGNHLDKICSFTQQNSDIFIERSVQGEVLEKLESNTKTKYIFLIDAKSGYGKTTLLRQLAYKLFDTNDVFFENANDLTKVIKDNDDELKLNGNNNIIFVDKFNFSEEDIANKLFNPLYSKVISGNAHLVIAPLAHANIKINNAEILKSWLDGVHFEKEKYSLFCLNEYTPKEQKEIINNYQTKYPEGENIEELEGLIEGNKPIALISALAQNDENLNSLIGNWIENEEHPSFDGLEFKHVLAMIYLFTKHGETLQYRDSISEGSEIIKYLKEKYFITTFKNGFTGITEFYDEAIFNFINIEQSDLFENIINTFLKPHTIIKFIKIIEIDSKDVLINTIFRNFDKVLPETNAFDLNYLFEEISSLVINNTALKEDMLKRLYGRFSEITIQSLPELRLYQDTLYPKIKRIFGSNNIPFKELPKQIYQKDNYININEIVENIDKGGLFYNSAFSSLIEINSNIILFMIQNDFSSLEKYLKINQQDIAQHTKELIEKKIELCLTSQQNGVLLSPSDMRIWVIYTSIYFFYSDIPDLKYVKIFSFILKNKIFNPDDFRRLVKILVFKGALNRDSFNLEETIQKNIKSDSVIFELAFNHGLYNIDDIEDIKDFIKNYCNRFENKPGAIFELFNLYEEKKEFFTGNTFFKTTLEHSLNLTIRYIKTKYHDIIDNRMELARFLSNKHAIVNYAKQTNNASILQKCINIYAYMDFNISRDDFYSKGKDGKYKKILDIASKDLYIMLFGEHKRYFFKKTLKQYRALLYQNPELMLPHITSEKAYSKQRKVTLLIFELLANYYLNDADKSKYASNVMANILRSSDNLTENQENQIVQLFESQTEPEYIAHNRIELIYYYLDIEKKEDAQKVASDMLENETISINTHQKQKIVKIFKDNLKEVVPQEKQDEYLKIRETLKNVRYIEDWKLYEDKIVNKANQIFANSPSSAKRYVREVFKNNKISSSYGVYGLRDVLIKLGYSMKEIKDKIITDDYIEQSIQASIEIYSDHSINLNALKQEREIVIKAYFVFGENKYDDYPKIQTHIEKIFAENKIMYWKNIDGLRGILFDTNLSNREVQNIITPQYTVASQRKIADIFCKNIGLPNVKKIIQETCENQRIGGLENVNKIRNAILTSSQGFAVLKETITLHYMNRLEEREASITQEFFKKLSMEPEAAKSFIKEQFDESWIHLRENIKQIYDALKEKNCTDEEIEKIIPSYARKKIDKKKNK